MTTQNAPLDEFMRKHRDELHDLVAQRVKAGDSEATPKASMARIDAIIDDIIAAIGQIRGLAEDASLPNKSQAARQRGRTRRQLGDDIQTIARDFGAISDCLGELGHRHGASFAAQEYQTLNRCVDAAIAMALEEYCSEAHDQTERAIAQRVGFLAHELRNALAGAQLAFDVLKHNEVGVNSRTGDVVKRGLTRVESLISQTLLAVRLQASTEIDAKRMNLGRLLQHVEDAASPQRDIRVVVEAAPDIEIYADEELLTSALSNLLQNALKFTRRAGTVVVRARQDDDGGATVEVEDECGGLPPGKKDELFKPFVQSKVDKRGLGLGLTITREAIHAHHGEVTVRDLPGKGCVFAVKLHAPRADAS